MKKYLIAPFFLGAFFTSKAQCPEIDCADADYTVYMEDGLSTSYNGSVCFIGSGTIPNWVNYNNWTFLNFHSDSLIDVQQNINFGSSNNWVETHGHTKLKAISMDGSDTIDVWGILEIENWVSNNSFEGSRNVIRLNEDAELFVGGVSISAGATLLSGGTGNNIKVIEGCYSIPLPIKSYFKAKVHNCMNYILEWDSAEVKEVFIERKDTGDWKSYQLINSGYIQGQLDVPTYFRLLIDGYYTPIQYLEPCQTKVEIYPNPTDNQIFIKGKVNNYSVQEYTGKVLLAGYDNQINLNLLSSGTYLLTINNSQTFKIVKK